MDARGRRRVIIASIVAASLVAVAAIGTTAFLVIRAQQRSDDVAEATRVADAYTNEVTAYRDAVWTAALVPGPDHPRATRAALRKARVDPPRLRDAPAWGKGHSTPYLEAVAVQENLQVAYDRLERTLNDALPGEAFLKAAHVALEVEPGDFVKSGQLSGGQPLRSIMIPGIEKALRTFDDVPVPADAKKAATAVRAALTAMIDQARVAAANLDAGRGGSIEGGRAYDNATAAVHAYAEVLKDQVADGLESIAVRSSDQGSVT